MADDERNAIAQLSAVQKQLEQATTIPDIMGLHAMASAVEVLARQARLGTAAINTAVEVRLLCERKLATAVDEGQAAGELANPGHPKGSESERLTTYADAGLSKRMVSEARSIRDAFTDDDIRRITAKATERDQWVARSQILEDARRHRAAGERADAAEDDAARVAEMVDTLDIRTGAFADVLGDVSDVDAIITDPPYPKEFLPLYGELAAWADRVLKPDGLSVVLCGHVWLPEVIRLMDGHRPYRWVCAYMTPGPSNWSHARRVFTQWKPLLVYGGGNHPREMRDVFTATGDDKEHHHWGQNLDAFVEIVETFTRPGQLVADPFLGGGTTAAACLATDRRFVGADIDGQAVATTTHRLAGYAEQQQTSG